MGGDKLGRSADTPAGMDALLEAFEQQSSKKRHRRKKKQAKADWQGLLKLLLIILLGIVGVLLLDGLRRESHEFAARVVNTRGTVQVQRDGEAAWSPIAVDERLRNGDLLGTGPHSNATLVFPDGSAIGVEPNTQFEVRTLDYTRNGRRDRSFMVRAGAVICNVSSFFGAKSEATVCTPTAVAAVRGTSFRVSYDPPTATAGLQVAGGLVEYRTPTAKGNVAVGREAGAQGYAPRPPGTLDSAQRRQLQLGVGYLANYDTPPTKLNLVERGLTNLADPILQLLGICPGGWGYNSIDLARRTACMEALRRLRQQLEGQSRGAPDVLNPVTLEELKLHPKEHRAYLGTFAGGMLESYSLDEQRNYTVIVRARDKQRTRYRLTAAELVEVPEP